MKSTHILAALAAAFAAIMVYGRRVIAGANPDSLRCWNDAILTRSTPTSHSVGSTLTTSLIPRRY